MDDFGFFGASIPQEVRAMIPLLPKLNQTQFRKAVQCAVEHLKNVPISDAQFERLSQATQLPKHTFAVVFTGLYFTLKAATKSKVKVEAFQSLLVDLKIPESFVSDLVKALQGSRPVLESSALINSNKKLPQLQELFWRVDVTISTTSMSRSMKPSILFQMVLDDGRVKTFEVPHDSFHHFRYCVAKVLKDIDDLEKHPILKVDT